MRSGVRGLLVLGMVSALVGAALPARMGASRTAPISRPEPRIERQSFPPAQAPNDPRALYQALNELRPDAEHVFAVRDLALRRSAIDFTLIEGKLAFLTPLNGKVTGAVFTGRAHIIATPRDAAERRSLVNFVGVPLLDQAFSRAYFRFTDDTAAELLRHFEASGVKPAPDSDFAEEWNNTVSNLNSSHSLRIMMDFLSSDPQPYFSAALAGAQAGPFDVLVDRRRDEPVLIGAVRNAPGGPKYEVWASFAAPDAPPARENMLPVDYRLDTSIGDDLALAGDAHLHLKAARDGDRVFGVELSRLLSVESVTLEGGAPLVYFHNEDLSREELELRGNDLVYIVLAQPMKIGEEFRLEIRYHGSVIGDAGNGVYFVGDRGSWYPHVLGLGHFTPFDMTFRWPKKLTLVATGTPSDLREDAGRRSGHWMSSSPIAIAGFNLGEYEKQVAGTGSAAVEVYANRQIEDAILSRLRERSPNFVPNLRQPDSGLPEPPPMASFSEGAAPPSPAGVLKQLGGRILDSIHFFEGINGPFPFDHLAVSPIPGSFGQGWPGLIYLSTLAYLPRETQEEAGLKKGERDELAQLLPFHEIAHQWWGNVVGTAGYRDTWIQEAMANYLSLMYADSRKPTAHVLTTWLGRYRAQLIEAVPNSGEIVDDAGPLTLGYRLRSAKAPDAYERIIYGKGTWVIHMLREMLRDPAAKAPDARFEAMLRSVLTEHRFQAVDAADLQRAAEKQMTPGMDLEGNKKLDWFFDEWVLQTGIPRYSVEFQERVRGQEFAVSGKLKQDNVPDYFIASVPVYGVASGGRPVLLGTVVATGPQTSFHFTSRFRPSKIVIDPQGTILCKTN
ncbi:MAG: M1 family aminopeptidase [Candidatus Acidiferrales bacterium]